MAAQTSVRNVNQLTKYRIVQKSDTAAVLEYRSRISVEECSRHAERFVASNLLLSGDIGVTVPPTDTSTDCKLNVSYDDDSQAVVKVIL